MIPQSEWRWFGSAGHFICAQWCRFHLCTQVGPFLISTVGELWFERPSREIHARIHDPAWLEANGQRKGDDFDFHYMQKFGFEELGYKRKYETMVFKAGAPCKAKGCNCGLPEIEGNELDMLGSNDAKKANDGHYELCLKYSALTVEEVEASA